MNGRIVPILVFLILGSRSLIAQEPIADPVLTAETVLMEGGSAQSKTTIPPANPYLGDLRSRSYMTGDWFGTRSVLADRGVTFNLFATQFYQGVATGGRNQEFNYGGKLDYLTHLDGEKLGLWQGFFVDMHAETRFGTDINGVDGLIAPSTLVMQFPRANESITAITGLKITQALSENFAVYFGKMNTLDEYPLKYSPGPVNEPPGLAGFQNTSLVFNPILARTVPYSAAGAGAAILANGAPLLTVTVFDPRERAAIGLEGLFDQGITIVPELQLRVKPFGRPGVYDFGGSYSNARYRSFDPAAYLDIPLALVRDERLSPQETGSWSLFANFYQSVWVDSNDTDRTWGVFGQFGLSDGNPNPVRFVANGGIGGRSPLACRKLDTFGAGYFYLGMSDAFKSLAAPLLPQRDEFGVELFYNIAVTPWCRLTTDLQIARPSTAALDTALLPGLRLQMIF